jgi:hypothetical protein
LKTSWARSTDNSIALPVGTTHTMNDLAASGGESDPEEIDRLLPRQPDSDH